MASTEFAAVKGSEQSDDISDREREPLRTKLKAQKVLAKNFLYHWIVNALAKNHDHLRYFLQLLYSKYEPDMGMALDSSLDERLNSIKRVTASVGSPDMGLSGDYGSYWRAILDLQIVEHSQTPKSVVTLLDTLNKDSKSYTSFKDVKVSHLFQSALAGAYKASSGTTLEKSMVKAYLGEHIDPIRVKGLDVADGPSANIDVAYGDSTNRADQPPHTSTGSVHALLGTVELSKVIKSVPGNLVRPIALILLLNPVSALDRDSFKANAEVNASSALYEWLFTSWPINAIGLVIALTLPFVGEHTKAGKEHVVSVSMLVFATLSILITTDSTTPPALLWTVRLLCVYATVFYAKIQYESYNMSLFHILSGMIGVFIIDFLAVGVSQSSPIEYPGDERIRFVFASFAASAFLCTCYAFLREQSGSATPTMHQPGEQDILGQSQQDEGDERDQRLEEGLGGPHQVEDGSVGDLGQGLYVVGSD